MNKFIQKAAGLHNEQNRSVLVMLNPRMELLPAPSARYDDPFLPFSKAIIQATRDLVCGYVFDLASYMVPGAPGVIALERSVRYVPDDLVTILHGPFWGSRFNSLTDPLGFGVDAITLVRESDVPNYNSGILLREGAFDRSLLHPNKSIFWINDLSMSVITDTAQILSFAVTDDRVLYAGGGEDFAERTRQAIQQMGHNS